MCGRQGSCSADKHSTRPDRRESHRPRELRESKVEASWSVDPAKLFTIGHSTRSLEEFLGLLEREGVTHLLDVRAFPASRRYPYFNGTELEKSLGAGGIRYTHVPELGGRRT